MDVTLDAISERYVDLAEAAVMLKIHQQSARRLIKNGRLPAMLRFGKYVIERHVVQQFASGYTGKPGPAYIGSRVEAPTYRCEAMITPQRRDRPGGYQCTFTGIYQLGGRHVCGQHRNQWRGGRIPAFVIRAS